MTASTTALPLGRITLDPRCYARALPPDPAKVLEYYEHLLDGSAAFPPLDVTSDGQSYWLTDGRIRLEAYRMAGRSHAECRVAPGGLREARLRAAAANAAHGLPRTGEDKRRAVWSVLALLDEEGGVNAWSSAEVARHCGVGHPLVSRLKVLFLERKAAEAAARGLARPPANPWPEARREEPFIPAPSPATPGSDEEDGLDDVDRHDLELVRERWFRAIRKVDRFSALLGRSTEELLAEHRAEQSRQAVAAAAQKEAEEALPRRPAAEKAKTPFDD